MSNPKIYQAENFSLATITPEGSETENVAIIIVMPDGTQFGYDLGELNSHILQYLSTAFVQLRQRVVTNETIH
ncbi:hypothetical protein Axy10_016 [Achromobacter phage vB_AxyP_19-32_Axy10]|uniref:Uncharacterized protein n=1 Tax=Achromobacter phage vB_AxyP_19-32_Axy10 TaxID=2591041 RepID=A0A514CU45_9CAUD|nr:hypothetical protein KMC59_gp16 [Achromobacter phage vB_AxyP_19-32_Axy10]QDH83980.1 hypothetical protein Axy10_016 [Achromobacter phage vB_AxyP_19-32_Axy10]